MEDKILIDDPHFLHGKILAVESAVLALAQQLDRDAFGVDLVDALERLRVALIPSQVHDNTLLAIDIAEDRWRSVLAMRARTKGPRAQP